MAAPRALAAGLVGTASFVVEERHTAIAQGSGSVRVFGTPQLVALMEAAAVSALAESLDADSTSVGTSISAKHTAATPVGMRVSATATVVAVEGKKVRLTIEARDEKEAIGTAEHERFVVNTARFEERCQQKAPSANM